MALEKVRSTRLSDNCFYLAYAIYLMKFALENSTLEQIGAITVEYIGVFLDCLVLGLLFIKFLSQQLGKGQLLCALSLTLVSFFVWRNSSEGWLFWLVLFVIAAKDISYLKLSKVTYKVCLASVLVVASLSVAGIIPDIVGYRGGYRRISLGFEHPNQLGLYLLMIVTAYSASSLEKGLCKVLPMFPVAILANKLTCDSRTLTYLLVFQVVLFVAFKYVRREKLRCVFLLLLSGAVVSLVAISLYFLFFFDGGNPLHELLDTLLSGRFYLANKFYVLAGLSIFGCNYASIPDVPWVGGERVSFLVDNAYLHCLQRFGIIAFILLCVALLVLLRAIGKNRCWNGCIYGLFIFLIYAFTETGGLRVENLYLVLGLAGLLYGSDRLRMRTKDGCKREGTDGFGGV